MMGLNASISSATISVNEQQRRIISVLNEEFLSLPNETDLDVFCGYLDATRKYLWEREKSREKEIGKSGRRRNDDLHQSNKSLLTK